MFSDTSCDRDHARLLGLVGYPLEHSFSAAWFAERFARAGMTDTEYRNFPLRNIDMLPDLLSNPALIGFNVTAPYKRAVMAYLSAIDPIANRIGAVNCVVRSGDGWTGYNVDWKGFSLPLEMMLGNERPAALILGTGGAAAAAAYALGRLRMEFTYVSRTIRDRGTITYDCLDEKVMSSHLLIINATPLGTYPAVDSAPEIPYRMLTPRHILYDMVYNPPLTEFLRHGKEAGARTLNGRRMLELQAEYSWELFFDK